MLCFCIFCVLSLCAFAFLFLHVFIGHFHGVETQLQSINIVYHIHHILNHSQLVQTFKRIYIR
jgi:hypothetical protein